MSDESIKIPTISDDNLNPKLDYFDNPNFWVKINESCLKTESSGFNSKKRNFYFAYEMKL